MIARMKKGSSIREHVQGMMSYFNTAEVKSLPGEPHTDNSSKELWSIQKQLWDEQVEVQSNLFA